MPPEGVVTLAKANCYSKSSGNLYTNSYTYIYIWVHVRQTKWTVKRLRRRLGCIVKRAAKRINHRSTAATAERYCATTAAEWALCACVWWREIILCVYVHAYIYAMRGMRRRRVAGRGRRWWRWCGGDVAAGTHAFCIFWTDKDLINFSRVVFFLFPPTRLPRFAAVVVSFPVSGFTYADIPTAVARLIIRE